MDQDHIFTEPQHLLVKEVVRETVKAEFIDFRQWLIDIIVTKEKCAETRSAHKTAHFKLVLALAAVALTSLVSIGMNPIQIIHFISRL